MLETPAEIGRLQDLLDRSAAGAGPDLRDIITDERRLSAVRVCELLQGMRLLVAATVTADGRPLALPGGRLLPARLLLLQLGPGLRPPAPSGRPSRGQRQLPAG